MTYVVFLKCYSPVVFEIKYQDNSNFVTVITHKYGEIKSSNCCLLFKYF